MKVVAALGRRIASSATSKEITPMNGHCLCGAVSFTSPEAREIGACHCGFCRRWGGGPLLAVHCGPNVQFKGVDQITTYASSEWAERAFCKNCGSHLYYKLLATGEYFVPAGAFESADFELASRFTLTRSLGTTPSPMQRQCSPNNKSLSSTPLQVAKLRPSRSLKQHANGRPPGPGHRYGVHFLCPGPGVVTRLA